MKNHPNFDMAKIRVREQAEGILKNFHIDDLDSIRLLQEICSELLREAKRKRALPGILEGK